MDSTAAFTETHISWVFMMPDRVLKVIKPIALPFVDFSDTDHRVECATREVELNRRIAPDVYLGTADVIENGVLVDRIIVMRRLPADRQLASLIVHGESANCLRDVVRAVAAFHSRLVPVMPAPMATRDAVAKNWSDNFDAIEPFVDDVIARDDFERARALSTAFLAGRERLFETRIGRGHVRDGHGDLTAEDIFCMDDGPRIIDCLAFDDTLRIGDVVNDIAFLAMDVHRLAGPHAADAVMHWYREFSNSEDAPLLAHHYIAYRAHVRAKVACLRLAQGDAASVELARMYHRLALDHLERARVRLVLVGGGPGTGKSTLARAIGEHYGIAVLSTDEIRKDVTGMSRDQHDFSLPGEGIYDDAGVDAVYVEQQREAEMLLRMGRGAVLDASWTRAAHRDAARALADRTDSELVEIECTVDREIARRRIEDRSGTPGNLSDATPDVADYLASRRDPWPTAVKVSTAADQRAVARRVIERIDGAAAPLSDRDD